MTDNTKTLLAALTINNGKVVGCNNAFTEQLGFTASEIINTSIEEKLNLSEDSPFSSLKALLINASQTTEGVFTSAKIINNLYFSVSVKLHCVHRKDDTFELYLRISNNKSIDPISGIPNGWALTSRVNHLLSNQKAHLNQLVLVIIEVDNFSTINYRYDFAVGDKYLVKLAKLLQNEAKDIGFVIRFSNGKYAILIEQYNNLPPDQFNAYIEQICQHFCLVLAAPIVISPALKITKSFSIGASTPGFEYDSYASMEIAAEEEKQRAKKYSINKYYIALPDSKDEWLTRKLITDALPQAIIEDQIQVFYQPQYNINTNQLIGLEALSRWNEPNLGYIPPNKFVAIAEDIGLHFEFDLWVFEKVCYQVTAWQEKNIVVPRVAVNVSFKTMEMSTFIDRLKVIIEKSGCPTHLLELEVTETSSIHNTKTLANNMLQAKALGMHIAVDDFGTGYSSLSLIRTFHKSLDKLKLDRSLVELICQTKLDKNFTKHIIELGKILNLDVLAEGVETQQQLDLLTALGCDYGQGYYFSKARSSDEITLLLQNA